MAIDIIFFIIVFGAILFVAYVTTKYVAKKGRKSLTGSYIRVVDVVSIGVDKNIYLIKVGNEYSLISSSGKNIEFLTNVKIDINEVEEYSEEQNDIMGFKDIFQKYSGMLKNLKNTGVNKNTDSTYSNEDFKNSLNRLKDITSRRK